MSTLPDYSINYFVPLAASGSAAIGQLMLPDAATGAFYVVATTANRGTRRCEGIAISSWSGATGNVGTIRILQSGVVAPSISGLGAGSASWVRCSATGAPERFAPALNGSSDVIGYCETDGRLHLMCGFLTETIAVGGGAGGATLTGTTNGVVSLTGANAGTADPYFQITAPGEQTVLYDEQILNTGHTIVQYRVSDVSPIPLGGYYRISQQLCDNGGFNSFPFLSFHSNTYGGGVDQSAISISGGVPQFGDLTGITPTAIFGQGLAISLNGNSSNVAPTGFIQIKDNAGNYVGGAGKFLAIDNTGKVTVATPSGFSPPTGTGFVTVAGGVLDVASLAFPLAASKGGTGANNSAATGLQKWSSGTGSVATLVNADVSASAAVAYSKLGGTSSETVNPQSFVTNIDTKGTATYVEPKHVQTTDATTAQTLDSFTLSSGNGVVWTATVMGVLSGVSNGNSYTVVATFVNNAGTVSQVGTTTVTPLHQGDATWVGPTMTFSGTTITMSTKGKAATTIQWSAISTRLAVIP